MRRTSLIFGLALLACSFAGCAKKEDVAKGDPSKPKGKGGLVFAVDVLPVEASKVDYVVNAPGTIEAFEHIQVTARVAGAVDRVAFSEGQEVKKGQVLVVIDAERFQLAVNGAKAAVDKNVAAQGDNEAMVTRREAASAKNPGLIPGEELATYKTKSVTAKADTQVTAEALKIAELNLRDSMVRAPMDGIVQTRTIETGQYVQAGYVMATLLRADPMLLRFQVQPEEAPRVKPGMVATFTMRETQRTFTAKISLVAGASDLATHMIGVTAELTDAEHKYWLRPGSFCDVILDLHAERIAPVIPRLAARATDHGYVAYVIEGEVAKERPVTLGLNTKDGWVEVRTGIAAGDTLVVHGGEALADGVKVKATHITAAALMSGDAGADIPTGPDVSEKLDGGHEGGHHAKPAAP
jgi:membrane fusion protein, multidrug efflux system